MTFQSSMFSFLTHDTNTTRVINMYFNDIHTRSKIAYFYRWEGHFWEWFMEIANFCMKQIWNWALTSHIPEAHICIHNYTILPNPISSSEQFRGIADQLFASFNSSISVTSFDTLSSCIISWLEEYCKPQVS